MLARIFGNVCCKIHSANLYFPGITKVTLQHSPAPSTAPSRQPTPMPEETKEAPASYYAVAAPLVTIHITPYPAKTTSNPVKDLTYFELMATNPIPIESLPSSVYINTLMHVLGNLSNMAILADSDDFEGLPSHPEIATTINDICDYTLPKIRSWEIDTANAAREAKSLWQKFNPKSKTKFSPNTTREDQEICNSLHTILKKLFCATTIQDFVEAVAEQCTEDTLLLSPLEMIDVSAEEIDTDSLCRSGRKLSKLLLESELPK